MTQTNEALVLGIAQALYDKQAEDIRILDVRGISTVTDICVIASGTSAPHLKALQKAAQTYLKTSSDTRYRTSGESDSGWVLLDAFTVVIHVFAPEAREYYDIEALWQGAKEIPFTPNIP
ncbi:MAG: ribosome silencing factor [Kiritimatiellae bacterium]|nr:ribosome silencing factor [Kiritimatiellia bacterium]